MIQYDYKELKSDMQTCRNSTIRGSRNISWYSGSGGGVGIIFVSQFIIIKLCEFSKFEFSKRGGGVRTHPTLLDPNMFVLAREYA